MTENKDGLPWTEKYRPQYLHEIKSNKDIVSILNKFIEIDNLPHLLLYGPPGTGKTSSIMACARQLYGENYSNMILELNTSDSRGIDVVRKTVKQFASSGSIIRTKAKYKMVILDEIDAQTRDAQCILRRLIEKYSCNVRFCLICNYINKIDPALQSRCTKFRFNPHCAKDMYACLSNICEKEQIDIGKKEINDVVKISAGDLRSAINTLQSLYMTFGISEKIKSVNIYKCLGICSEKNINYIYDTIMSKMSHKDIYTAVNEYMSCKNLNINNIMKELFMKVRDSDLTEKELIFVIDHMADIEYKNSLVFYYEINLLKMISIFTIIKGCPKWQKIEKITINDIV